MLALVHKHVPGWEIVRFAITGVLATVTHYLVLWAGVEQAGMSPVPANGLAFCTAVGVTYAGQSLWVFRVETHGWAQLRKFLVTALAGLAANMGLMALLNRGLGLDYRVAFLVILVVVPAGTFVANKYWVFARKSHHS